MVSEYHCKNFLSFTHRLLRSGVGHHCLRMASLYRWVTGTLALCVLLHPASCALFEDSSSVVELDPESYNSVVESSSLLWVTFWYDADDAKSQTLAKYVQEAADATHKFGVRFSAIDAVAHSDFAAAHGNKNIPGISFCSSPPATNPYTNETLRQAAAVQNAEMITNSKLIKQLVSQQLLDLVEKVSNRPSSSSFSAILDKAKKDGSSHAAIFFSKKSKPSPLVKSIAMNFHDLLPVGEVLGVEITDSNSLAKQLGVEKLPAFVLVPVSVEVVETASSFESVVMADKISFDAMEAFVSSHASREAPKVSEKVDGVVTIKSDADLSSKVLDSMDTWIVAVAPDQPSLDSLVDSLQSLSTKAKSQGRTQVGSVVCDAVGGQPNVCESVGNAVSFVSFKYGATGKDKESKTHTSLKKAFKSATSTLPSGRVRQVCSFRVCAVPPLCSVACASLLLRFRLGQVDEFSFQQQVALALQGNEPKVVATARCRNAALSVTKSRARSHAPLPVDSYRPPDNEVHRTGHARECH